MSTSSMLRNLVLLLCLLGVSNILYRATIIGGGLECLGGKQASSESSTVEKSSRDTSAPATGANANGASNNVIQIAGFDDTLIPPNSELDVNIGTNLSPFGPKEGRHRILVDPLFYVCDQNAKLTNNVTAFCFAISNYTGFATFFEYNTVNTGVSSSLSQVSSGTSHASFKVASKRTVLVFEANFFLKQILQKGSTIHRLKIDMQGHDLTAVRNMQATLRDTNVTKHIMAECFCPNKKSGNQIYQVDNSCASMIQVLQEAGYQAKGGCNHGEWGDVFAYKKGIATAYLPASEFDDVRNQYGAQEG